MIEELTSCPTSYCAFTMPSFRNAVFSLLAAAALASASDVTQLKKEDFDEYIKSNDIVLAECMRLPNNPARLVKTTC